ncbi:MAG: hypothetical protein OEZ32_09505 [Nitrospinota bacterium]|nr:hypothetical protein [Nitrospinota bacterium]
MERKAVYLSGAWRGLEIILNFAIVAYGAALALYVAMGPVDFRLADHWPGYPSFRLEIGDAQKPLAAFLLVMTLRVVSGCLRRRAADGGKKQSLVKLAGAELGPPLLAVSLSLSLYLLFVNVYQPWRPAILGLVRISDHDKTLEEAAKSVPENAVLYSTAGLHYRLFLHRPGSHPLAGVDRALAKSGIENTYFMTDTFLDSSRRDMETINLMLDPRFRLEFFQDSVYLFGPGRKRDLDEKIYIDQFLTFHAAGADHQVGRFWPDSQAPEGQALVGWPDKDKPGFLVYGRYMTLKRGRYQAVFELKVDRKSPDTIAELDVASDHGVTIMARRRIKGTDFTKENQWGEMRFDFQIEQELVDTIQLRVIYLGGAKLSFATLRALPQGKLFTN